ncbi:beta-lactamase/transpeptidase-like protein [Hypoxylon argillaceum]|nr:beta-lactamase/transpeptidase-like protein [Hypoxylon argillaceum]KAI1150933.1 beta-lactamase/transpeptidase-like protein [Nemania diffusa]
MRFTAVLDVLQIPLLRQYQPPPPHVLDPCDFSKLRNLNSTLTQIDAIRTVGGTSGVSVGVMRNGCSILEHHIGFSDVENQIIANSSTRYPLGSLTKAFVSVTIAELVQDGILDLDKPIITYIPELSFQSDLSLASRLTLRDILSHNTGLLRLDALWLGANSEIIIPKEFALAVFNYLQPVYPLRSQWLYNNWMYALAGEIIERVTNMSWGHTLQQRVLRKIGLEQTSVLKSDIPADSTALPYLVMDNKSLSRTGTLTLTDDVLMSSAGGVRSTVHDMLRWGHTLLTSLPGESNPILSLDAVFSGHSFMSKSPASDDLYTLGFAKVTTPAQFGKIGFNPGLVKTMPFIGDVDDNSLRVFYHNGALPGYNNCFMLIPSIETVIVVLTNSISHGDTADWAAQALLQAVLDSEHPIDLIPFAEEAADTWRQGYETISSILKAEKQLGTPEPAHSDLVGTYRHETGALFLRVYKEEDGDRLKFSINGEESQAHVLSHYHFDTFIFFPSSADERTRRGLFHYGLHAWLLSFERGEGGRMGIVKWILDEQGRDGGEVFTRHD